jgi:hypothetical protein
LIQALVRPIWGHPSTGRIRVFLDNANQDNTLQNIVQIAGHLPKDTLLAALDRNVYYNGPRMRITG